MASKLQFVSELANQTVHTVTQNADGWKKLGYREPSL